MSGDSAILRRGDSDPDILQVYDASEVVVVGFGGEDVPEDLPLGQFRDQLEQLIEQHQARELAFDLIGVSGLLGLLTALRKSGGRHLAG